MKTVEFDALVLDMDGVLWQDNQPLVDLPRVFAAIERMGWKVIFATNNSTRSPQQYVEKLNAMGVHAVEEQVLTSSMAVAYLMKKAYPNGGPVFIVGETGLIQAMEECGFYHSDDNVIAVVAGMDRSLTYAKMAAASLHIQAGAAFYATNSALTFPTPQGLLPGAGSVIAMLQAASGKDPFWAGKPEPTMYQMVFDQLGLPPQRVLAVGDRFETDIVGGQRAGCPTALVLSGVTTFEMIPSLTPPPTIVVKDLAELVTIYGN